MPIVNELLERDPVPVQDREWDIDAGQAVQTGRGGLERTGGPVPHCCRRLDQLTAHVAQRVGRLAREPRQRVGVLDFSDQVAGALEVVRAHPAVAAELRDRYRVVLLDEYQDTSVDQTDLLSTLFARTAVMAVGDPHQAIYGWRGASAGNLGGFADAFNPGARSAQFSLSTSWRNSARGGLQIDAIARWYAHAR